MIVSPRELGFSFLRDAELARARRGGTGQAQGDQAHRVRRKVLLNVLTYVLTF